VTTAAAAPLAADASDDALPWGWLVALAAGWILFRVSGDGLETRSTPAITSTADSRCRNLLMESLEYRW
jgi:hypothetical protein